jgi:hypothetical protein
MALSSWKANAAVKWAAKERSGFADPSSTGRYALS